MKIPKGTYQSKLPPIGIMEKVSVNYVAFSMQLCHLRNLEFIAMQNKADVEGAPEYFTITNEKLRLYPRPDKRIDVSVYFYPPMVKL